MGESTWCMSRIHLWILKTPKMLGIRHDLGATYVPQTKAGKSLFCTQDVAGKYKSWITERPKSTPKSRDSPAFEVVGSNDYQVLSLYTVWRLTVTAQTESCWHIKWVVLSWSCLSWIVDQAYSYIAFVYPSFRANKWMLTLGLKRVFCYNFSAQQVYWLPSRQRYKAGFQLKTEHRECGL